MVLPVVSVTQNETVLVPLCITNQSQDAIEFGVADGAVQNVNIRVMRNDVYLKPIPSLRIDPQYLPRIAVSPGEQKLVALNLRGLYGDQIIKPGVYRVAVFLKPLVPEERNRGVFAQVTEFMLVVRDEQKE